MSAAVVVTLALGIGANTAIFGVIDALLVDGATAQVVGIAPAGFGFPIGPEIWTPLAVDSASRAATATATTRI